MKFITKLKDLINRAGNKSGFSSKNYWEDRYKKGGNSGQGSYGEMAEFKAKTVNSIVKKYQIESVIDFGCGDGNQLYMAEYPKYIGLDVTEKSIEMCTNSFGKDVTKSFFLYNPNYFVNHGALVADLGLSMEVIFHLIEDEVYFKYLKDMKSASQKYMLIFSTCRNQPVHKDAQGNVVPHVKHRNFIEDLKKIAPEFVHIETIENMVESKKDIKFYLLQKQ